MILILAESELIEILEITLHRGCRSDPIEISETLEVVGIEWDSGSAAFSVMVAKRDGPEKVEDDE